MPKPEIYQRGLEARDRLVLMHVHREDIFSDLPKVLQDVTEHFGREVHTFVTSLPHGITIDYVSMSMVAATAADCYVSYFNAFTALSKGKEYDDSEYRDVAITIMQLTYPILASQLFVQPSFDEFILTEWRRVIERAS